MDASHYQHQDSLRNGVAVLIRALGPDDRSLVVAAFNKLEPQSVYTRFFGFKKALSDAELERLDHVDFDHYVALGAVVKGRTADTLIAAASYVVPDPASGAAELAFTVEEDYQGQGLAGKLLRALIGIAREHGLRCLEADVLASNKPMLGVFERCGLPMSRCSEGGVTRVSLDLGALGEAR